MAGNEHDFQQELEQRLLRDTYYASFYELSSTLGFYYMDKEEYKMCARALYRDFQCELAILKRKQRERRK